MKEECRAHCTRRKGWCCVAATGLVECIALNINPDGWYRGIEEMRPQVNGETVSAEVT